MHLIVREHDTLLRGENTVQGERNISTLAAEAFDAMQALVLERGGDLNPVAMPTKLNGQDALKLTQWVGLIRTVDGTTIEILPKTHERPGSRTSEPANSLRRSRETLMRMLVATDERFRVAPPADLDPARMPLFEMLLRSVLESIKLAVRRGVPHAYVPVHEERGSFKGRLDLPRQVRQLPHRQHLLHVQYDEFLPDRPETRLTRLTVERVLKLTSTENNKRLARELLLALDEVPPSQNITRDFAQWRLERGHAHFSPLEGLCRLVLYELNPLVGGMTARAQAVLFDMNRVYESYVAWLLRQQFPNWLIETQVTNRALGKVLGQKAFALRPDLLITTATGEIIVADTKWKRLRIDKPPTYDIPNSDVYQMLAYHQAFQAGESGAKLWLIYPELSEWLEPRPSIDLPLGQQLSIMTVDLEQPTDSFHDI